MSAPLSRGSRRTAILAALATAAFAVPAYAGEAPDEGPGNDQGVEFPHDEGVKDDKAEPGFRVLTEVLNPATGEYVDGDADIHSRGDNDGVLPKLAVGDTAQYKVWLFNTGDVNLYKFNLIAPDCGLDESVAELPVGQHVRFTCSRDVVVTSDELCTIASAADPSAYTHDGKEYTVKDEQSERACVTVEEPSSDDPEPTPEEPKATIQPAPEFEPEQPKAETPDIKVPVSVAPRARLAIFKSGRSRVKAGERTYWHLRVKSTGNTTARKVILRDKIPNGFSVVRAKVRIRTKVKGKMVNRWRPVKYTVRNGNLRVGLGPLAAGRTKHIRVWMRAAKGARGKRVNVATVTSSNARPARDRAPIRILPGVRVAIAPAVTG